MSQIREMSVDEFARRLKSWVDAGQDCKFVFFLGAGCSISSGIQGAKTLVKQWLTRLKKLKTGDGTNAIAWAKERYGDCPEDSISGLYGRVIEDLFITPEERQREIETLIEGKDPGFGYAVLAQLMTKFNRHCNIALTVNFDDLIADALYLYTNKKPVVISHDSLVGFVRITSNRPLVIKLHGDARLEPKNTERETYELDQPVKKVLKSLLNETGLIFVGYGGNDNSIADIVNELPASALPWGIYWIGSKMPESKIGDWLKKNGAVWVTHKDFDELMLILLTEFGMDHPDKDRFDKLMETYRETFQRLKTEIEKKPAGTEDSKVLKKALDGAIANIKDWWSIEIEANKYKDSDPEQADTTYQKGLEKFPSSEWLLSNYALFLEEIRKDYDRAEGYYQKALEVDPNGAEILCNYANFLNTIRKDYDKAEGYYQKALEVDPSNAEILSNYAVFLDTIRKDYDGADEYFKKALEADPTYANNLGNYAGFLLGRGSDDKGYELLQRTLKISKNDETLKILYLECLFYNYAHSAYKKIQEVSLKKIKKLLIEGTRSSGWDFSGNVKRAIEKGHPSPAFLAKLANAIADELEIEELDDYTEWSSI